ncbi:hypothetical protein NCS57_00964000 [Fusarium keratoplasticum]|uniref:Uncharacterized protein n=1 Tax=Fusarium keratoplasticum TaxID=1328300 RepID=A0ACC0QRA6_9HYPO|nr:hypothetical protein NCS57_00964000 [Fusarium keratoplasticum]KAI8663625.1 hypothetical protein NCS57_00964000 [Fusarium keratoplasticum]
MISSFATSLILPPRDGRLAVAVLAAESTATTYLIHGCRTEIVDLNECDGSTVTMTLGPWARSSSPSEPAITGAFDEFAVYEKEGKNYTYSEHREMSGTVAQACTVIDEGAIEDPVTETLTHEPGRDNEEFTFAPYPVTITQGLDLLVAAESSLSKSTETDGTDDDAPGATTSEPTLTRGSTSETKASGSAAAQEETSAGASRIPRILAAVAAVFIASTMLV